MKKHVTCLLIFMTTATMAVAVDLPAHVAVAKEEVMRISKENTLRTDNIAAVRAHLEPYLDVLEAWFVANRPANEVQLTQKPWKNLWYDDPDIEFGANLNLGFLKLAQDRDTIYQVIQNGYYYNVSESMVTLFGVTFPVQNFLKGAYQIKRPAGSGNAGQSRLNVVDLEFVANSLRLGRLPVAFPLDPLVYLVELGWIPTTAVPGPLGVTGELWNVYVDEDLRVSAGFDDAAPSVLDLYILRRASTVE